MRRLPPTGALEAFILTARGHSLTNASKELNLSVSALSRRIRSLEDYVGKALFERLHNELRLTDAGSRLIEMIEPPFDRLVDSLSEIRSETDNRISIGVPPSFAAAWLLPRLHKFRDRHPDIDVSFDSSGSPRSKLGVSLDALILFADSLDPKLDMRLVKPQSAFAVAAPGLLPPDATLADLKRHPLILHRKLGQILPSWMQKMGLEERPGSRVDYFDEGPLLVSAAEAGLGVALVLEDMVAFYPGQTPRLVRPFGESAPTPYSYYFATRSQHSGSPALRRFRDWLSEESLAARQSSGAGLEPQPL